VVDEAGGDAGSVHDVRLIQDGPVQSAFGAAFRVQGLIVGPPIGGTRLGYGRQGMTGPALLAVPRRVLRRRLRFVPWDRVAGVGAGVVRISGWGADLGEPPTIGVR
jgi:hypothetical protein